MCYTAKIPKSDTQFISVVCFSFLVCFSCMRGTGGFARGLFRASDQSARGGAEHARVLGMAPRHHFLAFRSPTSSVPGLTRACLSINNHGLLSCQTPNRIQPCTFGPASVLELWQLPQFAEKPAKPAHPALATCASCALRTEVGGSGPRFGSRCSSSESLRRSCCVAAQLLFAQSQGSQSSDRLGPGPFDLQRSARGSLPPQPPRHMSSTLCQAQVILRSQPVGTSPVGIWRWSFPRNHLPVAQRKASVCAGSSQMSAGLSRSHFPGTWRHVGSRSEKRPPECKATLGPLQDEDFLQRQQD